jgi:hypothetical protein
MKTPPTIDRKHLETLLDIHGADPARFPEAERAPALALLASDPSARGLLADAEALARALDGLGDPQPSAALRRAVAEIPLRHERTRGVWWTPFRSGWRAGLSAALIVLLGALSGAWSMEQANETNSTAEIAPQEEWQDMAALAFVTELDQELAP